MSLFRHKLRVGRLIGLHLVLIVLVVLTVIIPVTAVKIIGGLFSILMLSVVIMCDAWLVSEHTQYKRWGRNWDRMIQQYTEQDAKVIKDLYDTFHSDAETK